MQLGQSHESTSSAVNSVFSSLAPRSLLSCRLVGSVSGLQLLHSTMLKINKLGAFTLCFCGVAVVGQARCWCFLSMLSVLLPCLGACRCIPACAAVLVLNVEYLCVFLEYLCVGRAREEQHKPRRFILHCSPSISSNKAPFGEGGQIQSALSCTSFCSKIDGAVHNQVYHSPPVLEILTIKNLPRD